MIKIENISKYYGDYKVLDDVSITIEKGDIFGIIGQSGAGKSTLLRCINSLEHFDEGNIHVGTTPIKNLGEKELRNLRKNIGMIFQHFSLLERRTVFENVALPMECFGYSKDEIKTRVEELLKLVSIYDKKDDRPKKLSGGQKQRVAIARALTMNPSVLLCDEPTSALDPKTTNSILDLLEQINKKFGITIVIVTHQMEVIKNICTKTAIMNKGKIVEVGNTEEVFLNNSEPLRKILGDEKIILPKGINMKLLFTNDKSEKSLITKMARELDIDISIVFGKLERFRDDILGSLIINISENYVEEVEKYLDDKKINWEVVENEL